MIISDPIFWNRTVYQYQRADNVKSIKARLLMKAYRDVLARWPTNSRSGGLRYSVVYEANLYRIFS